MASACAFSWLLICFSFGLFFGVRCENEEEAVGVGFHKLEGRISGPDNEPDDWLTSTKVLVNGGEYLGFLREDGSFVVNNLPSGSYVVEVANPDYMFEPTRVDINSKGKIRARKLNLVAPSVVSHIPYPLKLKIKSRFRYFQTREQWRITDFIFSPMVLMMVLPLLLIMVMPKLMNAADPETQREMQQSLQNPSFEMPDLSETITSILSGGKKPPPKALKSSKKRQ